MSTNGDAEIESLPHTQRSQVQSLIDRNFKFLPGTAIREDSGAELQSLVFALKYSWVKFQILPQCICCEGICTINRDQNIKPGLVLFNNSSLMLAPSFSHSSLIDYTTIQYNTNTHL